MRTTLVPVLLVAALAPVAAQQTAPKQPSAKQQPTAAQHQHDPDVPIKGTGKMPDGWKVRFDDPAAKPDQVVVEEKDGALTFTTGPAGIYYKSDKGKAPYELSAAFSQLKPSPHPEAYGLFFSGKDLDKDTQQYTYFLIRQDGKFLIKSRTGAETKTIVDWKDVAAMREPKGIKTSNTLKILAAEDAVRFFVDDQQVHKLTRVEAAGGDGDAGVRVNHNLNIQVSKFALKKPK